MVLAISEKVYIETTSPRKPQLTPSEDYPVFPSRLHTPAEEVEELISEVVARIPNGTIKKRNHG